MKFYRLSGWLIAAVLVLAACAPAAAVPGTATPPATSPVIPIPQAGEIPEAVEQARQALAAQLGISPEQIQIHTSGEAQFPDACLGLPQGDEACAEVLTPGFSGILLVNGEQAGGQYEFRVDASGENVRFLPGAVLSARQILAQQLQLNQEDLRIVRFEQVDWVDSCLEVSLPNMSCAQEVTPGYRVLLEANGQEYEFHTDESGGLVLLADAPEVNVDQAQVIWESREGICESAYISTDQVSFGTCGGDLVSSPFALAGRAAELSDFVQTYASFEAVTPAGQVTLRGQGSQAATEAEQRMIAEWAHLVFLEALGGRSGASYGLAFAWHREGGIAGFCNDLTVYLTGWAYATSCAGNNPQDIGSQRLSTAELAQVYTWVDNLDAFEFEQTDPATTDAMTLRLIFYGAGEQAASDADRQAILEFAAQVYSRIEHNEAGTPQAGTAPGTPAEPQEAEVARQALIDYLAAFNAGDYERAVGLYGGFYDVLSGYNPTIDPEDHLALLEAGCRYNGLRCDLELRDVMAAEKVAPGQIRFTVTFTGPEGGLFELGPCCGSDPTETPPVSQFDFTVVEQDGTYRVVDLPVYQP